MRINGHALTITKTREIWKLQVSLNVDDRVLVYNRDQSHGQEFSGDRARYLIQHFGLSKWGKQKTYCYGRWLSNTATIQLEQKGEIPKALHPDW